MADKTPNPAVFVSTDRRPALQPVASFWPEYSTPPATPSGAAASCSRCPKCGGEPRGKGEFDCGSFFHDNGNLSQSPTCLIGDLRQQLAAVTEERDHLQAEIEDMINLVPEAHRIISREGAGPENPAMSLCLSINRLENAFTAATERAEKAEADNAVLLDIARTLVDRRRLSLPQNVHLLSGPHPGAALLERVRKLEAEVETANEFAIAIIAEGQPRFGLAAQGHIPTIERLIGTGKTWEEIGAAIGWDAQTAKQHYSWHLEAVREKS